MSDVNITTLTSLDLANYTLTGNVNITSTSAGTLNIGAGTITGNLTVSAPQATVINNASVGGIVIVDDVASGTWNEKADGNKLIINDDNGLVLNIVGNVVNIIVSENAAGEITITVDENATVESMTINKPVIIVTPKPVSVTIAEGVNVKVKTDDNDEGEIVTGNGSEVVIGETPEEDNEAPVVTVIAPTTFTQNEDSLIIKFKVEDDSELAFLEIDHSLGKHSGTPKDDQLPEFKLYPVDNPWGTDQGKELAATYGVTATYDDETITWTLIFGKGTALNKIKEQTQFKVYYVVEDVHGNAFGSMSPTSPDNTVTIEVEEPDDTKLEIKDASLEVDNGLIVEFSISKDIDLAANKANVEISYFTKDESENLVPISNTMDGENPLVKNKSWDGYLWDKNERVNYSKGDAAVNDYIDLVPANAVLQTLVKQGYHENNDMDYVDINWEESATYVVKIKVTDNNGKVSEKTLTATVD